MSVLHRSVMFYVGLFALTACAQPPVVQVAVPPETESAASLAAKAAAESAAHAKAAARASVSAGPALSPKDTATLSEPPVTAPPQTPAIPAAELRRRILALISSLQGPEQFTPEHIEAMMQVTLQDDLEWQQKDAEGRVTEGWKYWVLYKPPRKPNDPEDFYREFSIKLSPGQGSPKRRPLICSLDLEALAQDMVAMGYVRSWYRPAVPHAYFDKVLPDTRFGVRIQAYPYPQYFSEEPPEYDFEDPSRYCVLRLHITYGMNRE